MSKAIKPTTEPKKRPNQVVVIAIVVIIAGVLLWTVFGKTDSGVDKPIKVTTAQKLASIDEDSLDPLPEDDKNVIIMNGLLKEVGKLYHESPEAVGSATFVASQYVKRKGGVETNHSILLYMRQVKPEKGVRYKQQVLKYVGDTASTNPNP